jgi:hypothetical protein
VAIDIAGFITYLKDHAMEHGFHVHDERHFLETFSLRQAWEVDVHPESACNGPLDLNLAFDVEPRVLLALEDRVAELDDVSVDAEGEFRLPLLFNWALPPLKTQPDLVVVAAELAGIGGPDLPIEVSAVETFGALSDGPELRLSIVGKVQVSLLNVMSGTEKLCHTLDRCHEVSEWLVSQADDWGVIDSPI